MWVTSPRIWKDTKTLQPNKILIKLKAPESGCLQEAVKISAAGAENKCHCKVESSNVVLSKQL